ncbi:pentapeptide repeat-containing protein [Dolichospermum flos-aquae]|uniref:Pentapeptide repeat-containing protein n=1 Tax=Dolichospermum flos-aquae LEGE 04289 TaxID=1828708 RepID=A0ACC5PYW7_DOLFA|nr:pentapeptide repeat-containing protein [Dolichospermum flos-aquae]MBE9218546.1 pentapeptide repeat-containing protein [Dolichospermum flos-aquae LEGE 04289]
MSIQNNGDDFSNQDIRGADFSKKLNRINNNFQHSKAGIKPIFHYSLITLFCLLSILISVAVAIAILPVLARITPYWIPSLIGLSILGIFLFFIARQGFAGALLAEGIVSVIGLILIGPLLRAGEHMIVPGVFFGIFSVAIAFGGIVMFAFTITVLNVLSNRWVKYAAMIVSIAIIVVSVPIIFPRNNKPPHQFDYLIDIVLTGIILSIGFYIANRSLSQDKRFDSIRSSAIGFCSRCYSTSFRTTSLNSNGNIEKVNLTDADFTGATLRNVDFRKAILTKTRFYNARNIEYACFDENHYLQNQIIRQLAIKLDVKQLDDKNFNYLDLEGINLEEANLQGISFMGANLKNASLKNADLTGANLKQAQLAGADLTGANLTGACIEDWGITKETELKEVKCESIFLECQKEYDKNGNSFSKFKKQYPNDRKFENGEFIKRAYLAWERYEENKTTTINFNAPVKTVVGLLEGDFVVDGNVVESTRISGVDEPDLA